MRGRWIVAALCAVALAPIASPARATHARGAHAAPAATLEMAVTVDDLPQNGREWGLERMQEMTKKLVGGLVDHKIPAVGFVNEAQLFYAPGEAGERIALLDAWLSAGLELGNHTYGHRSFTATPLPEYEEQVVRGETVTKILSERHGMPYRYFRHPYLHTGTTREARMAFEQFLAVRGYTIAPVTMGTDDWLFGLVYGDAKERKDKETMKKVADAYLAYCESEMRFSEAYSQALFNRPIRQVLLLHANELNADHVDDLLKIYERHGYKFITLAEALDDPTYREPDAYIGPDGMGWFDRWSRTRGAQVQVPRTGPPEWVQTEYTRLDAIAPKRIPGTPN
jgi:peptidoglycan/xylan/chitin deacetylase (PgdA/CDA1 family)